MSTLLLIFLVIGQHVTVPYKPQTLYELHEVVQVGLQPVPELPFNFQPCSRDDVQLWINSSLSVEASPPIEGNMTLEALEQLSVVSLFFPDQSTPEMVFIFSMVRHFCLSFSPSHPFSLFILYLTLWSYRGSGSRHLLQVKGLYAPLVVDVDRIVSSVTGAHTDLNVILRISFWHLRNTVRRRRAFGSW